MRIEVDAQKIIYLKAKTTRTLKGKYDPTLCIHQVFTLSPLRSSFPLGHAKSSQLY